jgi:hypothetical protein
VNKVRETGVPLTHIQGGFEIDGWTQISVARSIRWDRARLPPGVSLADPPKSKLPSECIQNFAQYTPAVEPEYFVVFSIMPCLAPSGFEPIPYKAWLPPFHRSIEIQRLPTIYAMGNRRSSEAGGPDE